MCIDANEGTSARNRSRFLPLIYFVTLLSWVIGSAPAIGVEVTAKGILYSTTFSPKGAPFDRAVHPFTVRFQDEKWFIRIEDPAVTQGAKLGPEYMEAAFDGTSTFTTLYFSAESRDRMRNDPRLQRLISQSPVLAKAQQDAKEQTAKGDPLRQPLNTNSLSGYVDIGTYPFRLSFAGRTLWLGLVQGRIRSTMPDYIPDIFEEGQHPPFLKVDQVNAGFLLTVTNIASNIGLRKKPSPVELRIDSALSLADSSFVRAFVLNKFYPESGTNSAIFHTCQVSNLDYSVLERGSSILPALDAKAYVEDRRILNGKVVRYVETNGQFMVPGSSQSKAQLENINRVMALRNKSKPMSKLSAVCLAATVFVPVGVIILAAGKNRKAS